MTSDNLYPYALGPQLIYDLVWNDVTSHATWSDVTSYSEDERSDSHLAYRCWLQTLYIKKWWSPSLISWSRDWSLAPNTGLEVLQPRILQPGVTLYLIYSGPKWTITSCSKALGDIRPHLLWPEGQTAIIARSCGGSCGIFCPLAIALPWEV